MIKRMVLMALLIPVAVSAQPPPGVFDVDSVIVRWDNATSVARVTFVSWDTLRTGAIKPNTTDSTVFRFGVSHLANIGIFDDYLTECCGSWTANPDTMVVHEGRIWVLMPPDFKAYMAQRFFEIYVQREKRDRSDKNRSRDPDPPRGKPKRGN